MNKNILPAFVSDAKALAQQPPHAQRGPDGYIRVFRSQSQPVRAVGKKVKLKVGFT